MLDEGNFRYWKVRIYYIIRGIEEYVWIVVELGWIVFIMFMEKKIFVFKLKERWIDFYKVVRKLI